MKHEITECLLYFSSLEMQSILVIFVLKKLLIFKIEKFNYLSLQKSFV